MNWIRPVKGRIKRALSIFLLVIGVAHLLRWLNRRRIRILTYHRVNDDPDDFLSVSPAVFEQHMACLARDAHVVSLAEAVGYLESGRTPPPRTVAVTFDDGYRDNHSDAFPILKKYNIPATVFVVHDYVGTDRVFPWYDEAEQRRVGPHVMNWKEVEAMKSEGIHFGSHTLTHPILTEIDRAQAKLEIQSSKLLLEKRLGTISGFAFPRGQRGDFDETLVRAVQDSGYRYACTTVSGTNGTSANRFALRRTAVEKEDSPRFMFRLLLMGTSDLILRLARDSAGARAFKARWKRGAASPKG
jgi:peptidoglycan/xylan/chitin deacetylase (PgdA/CDA1 family)